ncbi:ThiF family adenylyltransferase [Vibrio vulnificus]|uniref:HesA/MoeB/ThiF family protein n=1 Tax=Vibrio vulnificus TaxID=672 RepID=UPI001A195D23|nr:ThiF family adenylyltransferase [Vibrio vulnificus]HAT8489398.1 ThiF family adenylyltransferase [Vibrio vulnificus]HDY7969546.1 ThiF family adenylyltransferase [Vibrio vulnificus]HDY8012371.1 ThiF family adenylyltransferase [Vibrio vulnificus]
MIVKSVNPEDIYRCKSSVALVYTDGILDVFLSNLREQFMIEIDYEGIIDLLFSFNGSHKVSDIEMKNPSIDKNELKNLIIFFVKKRVLIKVNSKYEDDLVRSKYRLINTLEDYCFSTNEVELAINMLEKKRVMIIGLGAVGTWVADSLARSGVKNFILVDDDKVELSNLHRQNMFFESSVGNYKVDEIERSLSYVHEKLDIIKIKDKLDELFFSKYDGDCDLVINCADYPSVDVTTEIVAKFCMKKNIPHIIGGGYNLHLTLIGQTVIPNQTACVKCFDSHLKVINSADLDGVKKLARKNRKIGSFAPLSSIGAAIASIDAFKVLIGKYEYISNSNKRIEFNIRERDINKHQVMRNVSCEWCGENGIYYK